MHNSLQSHVARLRALIGDGAVIVLEPAGYRLALDPDQSTRCASRNC
jgi:hypothetical protein